MQQEFTETSHQTSRSQQSQSPLLCPTQDGSDCRGTSSSSDRSVSPTETGAQRIRQYELAGLPSTPRKPFGFKVAKTPQSANLRLPFLPDDIWERIMSNLDPLTHSNMRLVSRGFYKLEANGHSWKLAFLNKFPGQSGMEGANQNSSGMAWTGEDDHHHRPSKRYFPLLSRTGSWRDEYIVRTTLIRSLTLGRAPTGPKKALYYGRDLSPVGPEAPQSPRGTPPPNRDVLPDPPTVSESHLGYSAVPVPTVSYLPALRACPTHLDVNFNPGPTKRPVAIHGCLEGGSVAWHDPYTGKKAAAFDLQLSEYSKVYPQAVPYGLDHNPALVPKPMDLSAQFGMIIGCGYPGTHLYFVNSPVTARQIFIKDTPSTDAGVLDSTVPRFNLNDDQITATWIAKSWTIPTLTDGKIGMMAGTAKGYIIAANVYPADPRETVRWAVCPGVPIISIKVDERFTLKRQDVGHAWIVVLNALGEVFVLNELPDLGHSNHPFHLGRHSPWKLVDGTCRAPDTHASANDQVDPLVKHHSRGLFTLDVVHQPEEQMHRAQVIEALCQLQPMEWRTVCHGWDMRRRLEVDFEAGDEHGTGEIIFVIDCGFQEDVPSAIWRYGKTSKMSAEQDKTTSLWAKHQLSFTGPTGRIMTSAIDMSNLSANTVREELHLGRRNAIAPNRPGHRARWLVVGTDTGHVIVWNGRDICKDGMSIRPMRKISTASSVVSSVAVTALYVVHGGIDGRVQAWDPLCSTRHPVRTIQPKLSDPEPQTPNQFRHNPIPENSPAVRAICLDPDPQYLRGLCIDGSHSARCWVYSREEFALPPSRRRHRYREGIGHGSRRQSSRFSDHIASEYKEMQRENKERALERRRLDARHRIGDLSEEEQLQYAQMLSEEAFKNQLVSTLDDNVNQEPWILDATSSEYEDPFVEDPPHAALQSIRDTQGQEFQSSKMEEHLLRDALFEDSHIPHQQEVTNPAVCTQAVPEQQEHEMTFQYQLERARIESLRDVQHLSPQVGESSRAGAAVSAAAVANTPNHASRRSSSAISQEEQDLELALRLSREEFEKGHAGNGNVGFAAADFPNLGASTLGQQECKGKSPPSGLKGKRGKGKKWEKVEL